MDMKKIKRFALLLIMASLAVNVQAQLEQAVKKIFAGDTVATHPVSLHRDSDSARVANLQKSLEEARLNEANMRMEMEQMRLQMLSADSVKFSQQRQRIDSLRQFTKGIPVVAEGDTLFYLFTKRGGYTPQQRAQMTGAAIEEIGKRFNLRPDSVSIDHSDIVSDLMYGNKVLLSLTDQDALWEGVSRDSLAKERRQNVITKLHEMKAEHSIWRMAKRILYFLLVIVGQYLLFRLTNWLFRKLKVRILRLKDTKIKPVSIQGYELLDAQKQANLLVFFGRHRTLYPYGDTAGDHCPFDFYHLPADRRISLSLTGLYLESDSENLCGYNRLCPQSVYNCCYLVCGEVSGTYGALSGS